MAFPFRAPTGRAQRGFTLMELLVVIIIVGILAVMAIPSMSIATYDRDTYNDAGTIMQVFRAARTRAIARGSAVVVKMITTGSYTRGGFFTYEAVAPNATGAAATQTPLASCKYPTTWPTTALTPIDGFVLNTSANAAEAMAGIMAQPYVYTAGTPTATPVTEAYVCYTPLGRSYLSIITPNVAGAPSGGTTGKPLFTGLSTVSALEVRVTRTDGATTRSVLIPNNGMARLFSHTL